MQVKLNLSGVSCAPEPGQTYRHTNGLDYEVITLAQDTDKEGVVVVHRGKDGQVFIRSIGNFMGYDSLKRKRFTLQIGQRAAEQSSDNGANLCMQATPAATPALLDHGQLRSETKRLAEASCRMKDLMHLADAAESNEDKQADLLVTLINHAPADLVRRALSAIFDMRAAELESFGVSAPDNPFKTSPGPVSRVLEGTGDWAFYSDGSINLDNRQSGFWDGESWVFSGTLKV